MEKQEIHEHLFVTGNECLCESCVCVCVCVNIVTRGIMNVGCKLH